MTVSRWILLRMGHILDKIVEKIKTHVLRSVTFFRKLCGLWDNAEKYGADREAADCNVIWRIHFACWISKTTSPSARRSICARARTHTHTHTHTHIYIYNRPTYCFSTATVVTWTRLAVKLHVDCFVAGSGCSVGHCFFSLLGSLLSYISRVMESLLCLRKYLWQVATRHLISCLTYICQCWVFDWLRSKKRSQTLLESLSILNIDNVFFFICYLFRSIGICLVWYCNRVFLSSTKGKKKSKRRQKSVSII
jgi:hypothetical protein